MASFNGINYAKTIAKPAQKAAPGEINGRVKWLHEKYVCTQDVYAIGDLILGPKLPAGAKVIDALFVSEDLGTTGVVDLGFAASEDLDGTAITADPNGLISGADCTAAVRAEMALEAGLFQDFGIETQVQAVFTTASDAADTKIIHFAVAYVID